VVVPGGVTLASWLRRLDPDVFPTAKTAAAIRKQAPVVAAHVLAALKGREASAVYDGYSACPLITTDHTVMLMEFDYSRQPVSSFLVNPPAGEMVPVAAGAVRFPLDLLESHAQKPAPRGGLPATVHSPGPGLRRSALAAAVQPRQSSQGRKGTIAAVFCR
jgi:hypothetical protein